MANYDITDILAYTGIVVGAALVFIANLASPIYFLLFLAVVGSLYAASQYDYFRSVVLAAGVLGFVYTVFQFFDLHVLQVPAYLEPVNVVDILKTGFPLEPFFDTPVDAILASLGSFFIAVAAYFLTPEDAEPRIAFASLPLIIGALTVLLTGNILFGLGVFTLALFVNRGKTFEWSLYVFAVIGITLDVTEIVLTVQQLQPLISQFIFDIGFIQLQNIPASITSIIGYASLPLGVAFYKTRWRSKEELEREILGEPEEGEDVMWEEQGMLDVVRSYVRENPRQFQFMVLSVLVGVLILSMTNFYFFSVNEIHTTTFNEENAAAFTLRINDPATFEYTVPQPEEREALIVELQFRSIDRTTAVDVALNQEILSTVSERQAGSTETFTVQSENIEAENTLTVMINQQESLDPGNTVILNHVSVRGTTPAQRTATVILNFFGILSLLAPVLFLRYNAYRVRKDIEDRFPDFLRDVVSGTRAGMSLTQAIKNVEDHDYGKLTPRVKKIAAQLDWGLPFEQVMKQFAKESKSKLVQRAVSTVNQTYRSGGDIYKVLETVSENIEEIKKLRRERESELYSELVSGYIIYFVFLLVLVVMAKYLIPSLVFEFELPTGGGGITNPEPIFSVFRGIVIIQSVFSGLVIGKLSEGEIKAGAKHVGVLLIVGYIVSVLFI